MSFVLALYGALHSRARATARSGEFSDCWGLPARAFELTCEAVKGCSNAFPDPEKVAQQRGGSRILAGPTKPNASVRAMQVRSSHPNICENTPYSSVLIGLISFFPHRAWRAGIWIRCSRVYHRGGMARPYYTITFGAITFTIDSRYVNLKPVGSGAYSYVVAADDLLTGQKVAIKKVANLWRDLVDAKRMLREIKLLRHLTGHDNIVELLDIMTDPPDVEDFKDM